MEEESECAEPVVECLGEEDEAFNLVEELQRSTMMRTRDRYKSSTGMFLLHLYRRNHPAVNPTFAEEMKKVLEGPRPRGRCTDVTLIRGLLPGYCQATPLEPLLWEKVTPEVILAPIANIRREHSKTSDSKINAYRAAIHLLFKDFEKTNVWQAIAPTVSTIINGWKKRIARKRKEDGVEVERGMSALPFKLYVIICKQLAQHKLTGPFAWCYATLLWNLMCRSDNISYINLGHIKCKDDHLLVYFAHSKTDQEGRLAKYPRAVYANPLDPWICPITALGVYLICISTCVGGPSTGLPLFQGSQEDCARRFRACLSSEVKQLHSRLEELGLTEENIGTHSFRKGAATYASAGGTACPSSSSISLRAGWSQPGVEDTYRRFDAAGDEHVGRVVTGLRMHHEELALLPPTFVPTTTEEQEFIMECARESMDVTKVNPGVAWTCLASVMYHLDTLKITLPSCHKLWSDRVLSDASRCARLRSLLFCGYEDDAIAQQHNLCTTGVPPHCSLLHSLEQVKGEVVKLIPGVEEQIGRLPLILQKALDEAVEAGRIEGAPITTANLERTIMRVIDGTGIHDIRRLLIEGQSALPAEETHQAQLHTLSDFGLCPMAPLPSNFMVPNMTMRKAWQHWTSGDERTCRRPWRSILPAEVTDRQARDRLKRYRKIMLAVQDALPDGAWKETATIQDYDAMFDGVKAYFEFTSGTSLKRRHGELSWDTVLRLKYKHCRGN